MKKPISFLLSILFALSILIPPYAQAEFIDVSQDSPAWPAINYYQKSGIISGKDGLFRPNDLVQKIEFIKMLIGVIKDDEDVSYVFIPYEDLEGDQWYSDYIKLALKKGVVTSDETRFRPNSTLTLAQVVDYIYRYYDRVPMPLVAVKVHTYQDAGKEFDPRVYLTLEKALQDGLITPQSETRLGLQRRISRIEAVQLLYTARGLYQDTLKEIPAPIDKLLFEDVSDETREIFLEAIKRIRQDYLYQENIDPDELVYSSLEGLVEGIDDPYSGFYPPVEADEFIEYNENGRFEGIGAQIDIINGFLTITAPLVNSPAEKAGIKAGDIIVSIDGESTTGLTLQEAVQLIRGEKGTTVEFEIAREGQASSLTIAVVRDTINMSIVEFEQLQNNIAYFRLAQFTREMDEEFKEKYDQNLRSVPRGIIIDLRNNPGGLLSSSLEFLGYFLEPGMTAVQVKNRQRTDRIGAFDRDDKVDDVPIIVLINEASASASEIVAVALQEHEKAQILGVTSFGKGTVQAPYNLSDGSILKLTVQEWLSPNGNSINGIGVEPDIVVENDPDNPDNDLQLQRAIQTILQQ